MPSLRYPQDAGWSQGLRDDRHRGIDGASTSGTPGIAGRRRGSDVFYHVRTKGGSLRHRELPAPAFDAIEYSLRLQGTSLESLLDDAPLFAISSHGFYKNLKRYAERAGLKDVTPHVLRHAAAKLRRDAGASIEAVGSFLGHRSLHTTSRYLARLEGEHDPGWKGVADALGITRSA